MSYDGIICSSCGARRVVKSDGLYICEFCRSTVVPRLVPGALCSDINKGALCSIPAESLCTACARPLCSLHNDPKIIYWQTPLEWRSLCPEWDDTAGRAWDDLVHRGVRLPVDGFSPFPWKDYGHEALAAVGGLEMEIAEVVKAAVAQYGGDFYETGVRFGSICSICEAEVGKEVREAVSAFGPRYRGAAYRERLRAVGAELKQGIAYVEAFLAEDFPAVEEGRKAPVNISTLSPREAWKELGEDLKRRLGEADRLAGLLDHRLGGPSGS